MFSIQVTVQLRVHRFITMCPLFKSLLKLRKSGWVFSLFHISLEKDTTKEDHDNQKSLNVSPG